MCGHHSTGLRHPADVSEDLSGRPFRVEPDRSIPDARTQPRARGCRPRHRRRGGCRGDMVEGHGPGGAGVRELRVSMMGTFTVVDASGSAPAGLLRKAQDLLALILLAPRRSVLREHAAEALWP